MNRRQFDILIYFLGASLLVCIIGIIVLLGIGKPLDDILKITTGSLVTGLLGTMVRAPASIDDEPQPVHIVNRLGPAEAVPVDSTPTPTPLPVRKAAKRR